VEGRGEKRRVFINAPADVERCTGSAFRKVFFTPLFNCCLQEKGREKGGGNTLKLLFLRYRVQGLEGRKAGGGLKKPAKP